MEEKGKSNVPASYFTTTSTTAATTATTTTAAANNNNNNNNNKLASTHIFYPFAIDKTGTWHEMAIEFTQEIGRRIITIREDTREDNVPFPTLFDGCAKRKCGFFPQHHGHRVNCR